MKLLNITLYLFLLFVISNGEKVTYIVQENDPCYNIIKYYSNNPYICYQPNPDIDCNQLNICKKKILKDST